MADALGIFQIAVVVALSLTGRDLFMGGSAKKTEKDPSKKMPGAAGAANPTGANAPVGPNIKFLICYGCGYKKVFEEYAQAIHQRYPQISISGGNYPPGAGKQMVASVVSTMKWVLLGTVALGEKVGIWQMLSMAPPAPYVWAQQNKIIACIGIFFSCNAVENAMIQSGAFEVELNGMPIWSKLKSGRVPQGSELFEIIENQMQLSGPPIDVKSKQNTNSFPGSVTLDAEQFETKKDEQPASEDKDEEDETSRVGEEEEEEEVDEEEEDKEKKEEDEFSEIDRGMEDTAE